MCRLLVVLILAYSLVVAGASVARVAASPPALGVTGCGADDPSGRVLFRAYDASGKALDPSLALAGADGLVRGGVDVPDPSLIVPTLSGCRAVVRSSAGATFVVDGATGVVRQLDLGDPADDLRYVEWAGGGRWGFFESEMSSGRTWERSAALVDFATGTVTDLVAIESAIGMPGFAEFSPTSEALVVSALPNPRGAGGLWLVPTDDPEQLRPIGDRFAAFASFDASGERLLYSEFPEFGEDGEQALVVENVADGTRTVVATAPNRTGDEPFLSGSFLPGWLGIAVRYPDRFAILDPGDGNPRERFSLDGEFNWFLPAPSGQRGILIGYVAELGSDVDPPLSFVDLEQGTSRPLAGDGGEPVRIEPTGRLAGYPARWILLSAGGDGDSPRALASLDAETGAISPLLSLARTPGEVGTLRVSDDGRITLVVRRGDDSTTRITLLDAATAGVTELVVARSVAADLSSDGRWAAYSTLETIDDERTVELTIVETATGAMTVVGPGLEPVWLAP